MPEDQDRLRDLRRNSLPCAASEKSRGTVLCFLRPQILLRRLADVESDLDDARLMFIYASDAPNNLKATLDYYQQRVQVPVLLCQKTNVQRSAQHVMEFLNGGA